MAKEMFISTSPHETKVAVLEDEQLVELNIERDTDVGLVGGIYKGRVNRVLPGMQSAFVDIGLERDAFLYVSDFFEDQEEFDKIVEAAEARVLRFEQGQAVTPAPAPSVEVEAPGAEAPSVTEKAAPLEASPSAQPMTTEAAPAQVAPAEAPAETQTAVPPAGSSSPPSPSGAPAEPADYRRQGGRGGRRRRFGRGGFGDRKFGRPEFRDRPPERHDYSAPHTFEILPGESLAKYSHRTSEPSSGPPPAEPAAPLAGPVEPAPETVPAPQVEFSSATAPDPGSGAENAPTFEPPKTEAPPLPTASSEAAAPAAPAIESAPQAELSPASTGGSSHIEAVAESPAPTVIAEPSAGEFAPAQEGVAQLESVAEEAGREPGQPVPAEAAALAQEPEQHEAIAEGAVPAEPPAESGAPAEGASQAPAPVESVPSEKPSEPSERSYTLREPHQRPRFAPRPGRGGRRRPRPSRGDYRPSRGGAPREASRPGNNQPLQISELLKEGQEILVQIAKEPLGTKGARITSHIALPGRYLVYMPTISHIGVSRKIASEEERLRLRNIILDNKAALPGGFIVRTAGQGRSEEELKADLRYLATLWAEIRQKAERAKAPALIYRDLTLVQRLLRDLLAPNFKSIRTDSEIEYERILDFVSRNQPSLVGNVKLYTRETPLFEEFGIQQEIDKALKPKVWLKSGGYIVINQTEALVAIDVNTGKYVGKTNRLEDTIVKTNIDAVREIVRQIRLRDLGGIIVIDFIDMDERRNRQKVVQALDEALRSDRAPTKILSFNDFGLVALTRKRVKQSLERTLCDPCNYCSGSGWVKSVTTVCNEILAEARKMAGEIQGRVLTLRVNPEVAHALKSREGVLISELESLTHKDIIIKSDPMVHQERFEIY